MKKLIMLITILAFWGCGEATLEAISENVISSVEGCTNPSAANYNPAATVDDGSCDI